MEQNANPEIGRTVVAAGVETNCHDTGSGRPVMLLHGSGPGVTAWANWRLVIPPLSQSFRVIAPDIVGFGYTSRPDGFAYNLEHWVEHAIGVLDALEIEKCSVIGNSFGGALTLAMAVKHSKRLDRITLMGATGLSFELTPGLNAVWGYEPSVENMRALIEMFAYDKAIATEDLVRMRYEASIRPGYQESYANMFPAPRQRHIDEMSQNENTLRRLSHETLIIHGREDKIIPVESSIRMSELIPKSRLHVFEKCGHWTQIEKTENFCSLVHNFLSE